MFIYLDEKNYVYGYGSDPMDDRSIEVADVPEEVDRDLGCYYLENNKYILDENRKIWKENLHNAEKELNELDQWFTWYDQQVIQYQRSTRLGLEFDKNIDELDAQAVANAARIKELRTFMSTPYSE